MRRPHNRRGRATVDIHRAPPDKAAEQLATFWDLFHPTVVKASPLDEYHNQQEVIAKDRARLREQIANKLARFRDHAWRKQHA